MNKSGLDTGTASMITQSYGRKLFERELPVKTIGDFKKLYADYDNEHHKKELADSKRVIRQPSLV